VDRIVHSKLGQLLVMLELFTSIHHSMSTSCSNLLYTNIHAYIYIYICVCVCVYIYIYLYTYIHTHTHIHTLHRFSICQQTAEHETGQ
jgi:hypothetical protein